MNFGVPFFDDPNMFWVVVGSMLAIALVTIGLARWRGWLWVARYRGSDGWSPIGSQVPGARPPLDEPLDLGIRAQTPLVKRLSRTSALARFACRVLRSDSA